MATTKKNPRERIEISHAQLLVSRAEVADWNEIARTAKDARIVAKCESAAKRYTEDVEYLSNKIRYILLKSANVDSIFANLDKLM